jgi:hypothetical protein
MHEKAQFKVAFRRYLNTGMGSLFWCPCIWNTPETIFVPEQVWDLFSGVPVSGTLQKPFCSRTGMGSLFWCCSIWNTPEIIFVPEQVWYLSSGVPVSGTLQKPFVFQKK